MLKFIVIKLKCIGVAKINNALQFISAESSN
jgi:hypothetical protein